MNLSDWLMGKTFSEKLVMSVTKMDNWLKFLFLVFPKKKHNLIFCWLTRSSLKSEQDSSLSLAYLSVKKKVFLSLSGDFFPQQICSKTILDLVERQGIVHFEKIS